MAETEDLKITKKLGPGIGSYEEARTICSELNAYDGGKGWHERNDWIVVTTPSGPEGWHFVTHGPEYSLLDPILDIMNPDYRRFFLLSEDAYALVVGWKNTQRLELIKSTIRRIVTERYDDICWMDVYKELAAFVGIEFDPKMLPRERMLKNCERFVDSLLTDTEYKPA